MDGDFKTVFPRKFYQKFFDERVRPDNRTFVEFRPVHLEIGGLGTANGSSLVTIGNTKVICGVVSGITEVKPGEKLADFIKISVEFPHINTQQLKINQISEPSQLANSLMENIFKSSKCLRTEDLISCDGKLYQMLTCELVCLDFDGCLYDACCLALVSALMNTELQVYKMIPSGDASNHAGSLNYEVTDETRKLELKNKFFATTFALWNKDVILFDPTHEEEELSKGTMTVVVLADSNAYLIHKPGGSCITEEQLNNCLKESKKRVCDLMAIINDKFNFNNNNINKP